MEVQQVIEIHPAVRISYEQAGASGGIIDRGDDIVDGSAILSFVSPCVGGDQQREPNNPFHVLGMPHDIVSFQPFSFTVTCGLQASRA
jgi:hypothetical protein